MALPGFRNHPKFRRLVAALGIPEAHVLGHVEMMWEVCYESGNAVLGDSTDVELAAGWVGDPGVLCKALAECGGKTRSGLIEELEPDVWIVHDLLDHCPEYVEGRKRRVEERGKDKTCSHCRATFRSADSRSKFCSDACRKADWRERHKDDAPPSGDAVVTDAGRTSLSPSVSGTKVSVSETDRPITTRPAQPSPVSTTPPNPPAAAGGKPRRERRGKVDDLLAVGDVSPEAVKFGRKMVAEWRKQDPDGRKIESRLTDVVTRMDAIAKRQPLFSPEVQFLGGLAYCTEARQRYKAAQYFLSLEVDPQTGKPPFHPFCVAVVNSKKHAPAPPAAGPTPSLEVAHA